MTRALGVLCVVALLVASGTARAQGAPELHLTAESTVIGLGDDVQVLLTATSSTGMPADSRLGATPGFTVRGHNASPTQTHVNINGNQFDRYSLVAQWALHADRIGNFSIGPASVAVGDRRYSTPLLQLKVVPAGTAPTSRPRPLPRASPFPFPNMSPFGNLFPDFSFDTEPQQVPAVTTDPKLALDAPRGPVLFLHAAVDKSNAVVGEQVNFSVYVYVEADAGGPINEDDPHEASADDFVKHALLPEDQDSPAVGFASVGGKIWQVHLLRRWALFPLHAGDLTIGPMTLVLRGPRLSRALRASETVRVHVTEPPIAGRPAGYSVGDVGHFTLSAQVQPREVEQGAAVGVHVELSGSGNVPGTLPTPARADVDWFPPEVHEKMAPTADALGYGGTRSFDYVVRIKRAGSIDLGELRLPFWNPDQRRYEVARAALGTVQVTPSATAVADTPSEILTGLPPPRDALEGLAGARRHADDSPLFWWLAVVGGPLAFGAAVAGRAGARRAIDAWTARRTSPVAELRGRLAAARVACDGGDARDADAAVARALEAAVVAHAGVSVRGAVGDEVVERLARAGVAQDAASNVADLLRECEVARFSPDAADVAAARGRWARAQGVIRRLEKGA